MGLRKDESKKIGYQAQIDWYKERVFAISHDEPIPEELVEKDFESKSHTPEEFITILRDLERKSEKLEDKIAFLSKNKTIPINKETQPEIAEFVNELDPQSGGEYISYDLYDKILDEHEYVYSSVNLKDLLNNTTGDSSSDSYVVRNAILSGYEQYNKAPEDNSLERYANRWLNNLVSWNEHDYKISQILSFSDNYLSMTPDPGYIPWSARREVGEGRIDAKGLGDVWTYFSADYAERVGDFVDGIKGFSEIRPDPKISDFTARTINYTNKFLNQINYTFDVNFAADLVCCFMQWGIKLDMRTLKGLRALLQLLQTGILFDYTDVLNGIKDILNNIFRGAITHQLAALVNYIIQSIADPIKRWLNDPRDGTWDRLFACTPINELINKYITEAIDYLQRLLISLLNNWYKKIEIKNIRNTMFVELKNNTKIMGELAQLLDWLIYSIEAASKCGIANSPGSDLPSQLLQEYSPTEGIAYEFPEEENPNEWNSFGYSSQDSAVISSPSAGEMPGSKKETGKVSSTIGAVSSKSSGYVSFEECLKKIPKEGVFGVREWTNNPANQTSERK